MAYTQDQLTAIENAFAQGTTSVRLNGREITYRSLPEMQQVIDSIRADLGVSAPKASRSRAIYMAGGKGL